MRRELELQIAFERFLDVLADHELVQVLQIRQTFEKQDALCQLLGMLHLVDRRVALVVRKVRESPVLEHFRVQEILVDRGQLVGQHFVQPLQDLGVTLHARLSAGAGFWAPLSTIFDNASASSSLAHSRQQPQVTPTPSPRSRSSPHRAPCSAAWMIWRSVMPLQMQMYMAGLDSVNGFGAQRTLRGRPRL